MAGNKNVSILEKSVKIIGEICSDGVFDTSGTFNGTIVANVLTVKDGGHIEGKIFANELNIAQGGTVNGEIVANRVHLSNNASFVGDLTYNILSLENNSFVNGQCKKTEEQTISGIIQRAKEGLRMNEKEDEVADMSDSNDVLDELLSKGSDSRGQSTVSFSVMQDDNQQYNG